MPVGQKRKKQEAQLPSPGRVRTSPTPPPPAAHPSHMTTTKTGAAAITLSVTQSRTPPPSSSKEPLLLSGGPSLSSHHDQGGKERGPGSPFVAAAAVENKGGDVSLSSFSEDDSSSEWDSDNDSDPYDHLDDNNNSNSPSKKEDHRHHHPPLHIPDILWRPDLLPPRGIFPPSHFLTEQNWELWHNNWLSILLANGVPTSSSSSSSGSGSGANRFLLSIRDDYLLGAHMRMTMTPEVLRGNPSCENQLVEFVSARDLWKWLPVTLGDFSSGGGGGGEVGGGRRGGGGTIRIVRADQPWRIRGRTWTRFGRVVDIEGLREGERYDRVR